jgi:hypothetical protein
MGIGQFHSDHRWDNAQHFPSCDCAWNLRFGILRYCLHSHEQVNKHGVMVCNLDSTIDRYQFNTRTHFRPYDSARVETWIQANRRNVRTGSDLKRALIMDISTPVSRGVCSARLEEVHLDRWTSSTGCRWLFDAPPRLDAISILLQVSMPLRCPFEFRCLIKDC